ncbi:MAG TPA: choice-of-anchor Q domain-containing protein [Solirubrobacteraceae bacterium]|nr:choice-of-anchor Q domain-containing protein [Solirubrobacteraceae bacterium]
MRSTAGMSTARRSGWIVAAVVAVILGAPAVASATTWQVTTTLDPATPACPSANNCSVRGALADAGAGDTVDIPAGDFKLTQGPLAVTQPVTITGQGAGSTTLDGGGTTAHVLTVNLSSGTLQLNALTITGGAFSGSASLGGGGGIYVSDGSLTLTEASVTNNKATVTAGTNNGGAGIYFDSGSGTLTLNNSTISGNQADLEGSTSNNGGGGIYELGTLTLSSSEVTQNTVTLGTPNATSNNGGGGIYGDGTDITLQNSGVDNNTLTVNGSSNNGGGGIYQDGSNLTMTASTADGNQVSLPNGTSNNGGGAIYQDGDDTTLSGSILDGNTLTMEGTTNNGGGALYNDGSDIAVTGSTIAQNSLSAPSGVGDYSGGGAIYDEGDSSSSYENSTISDNTLSIAPAGGGPHSGGGAIWSESATTVSLSTIAENSSSTAGGAIENDDGDYTLINSIIADNSATPAGNCTVSDSGTFTSDGHNLENTNTCHLTGPGDQPNTEPKLAALGNNGGLSANGVTLPTQAEQAGSPTIDAGSCTDARGVTVTTDERGEPRPDPGDPPGVCDIGAFEAQPAVEQQPPGAPGPTGSVPVNTAGPTISGTPQPGDTLGCSTGSWSGDPTSYSYRWNRNGQSITGQTNKSYVVEIADETDTLTCTVVASNASGSGSPATSRGVFVGNPAQLGCPRPSGALSGTRVGPLGLGMTLKQAKQKLKRSQRIAYGFTDFCLYAGFGIRAATPSSRLLRSLHPAERRRLAGRLVIALTANPFYSFEGVKPGMLIASVAKRLHAEKPFHIGVNFWYLAPAKRATFVLKVRNGLIYEIGLTNKQLSSGTAKQQFKFMKSFSG